VPASGPKELVLVLTFGTYDTEAVSHENFCAGCPDWDKVGPTFTGYYHIFEAMKLWLLNTGHQIIATPGQLLSVETIAATMCCAVPKDRVARDCTVCCGCARHDTNSLCGPDHRARCQL